MVKLARELMSKKYKQKKGVKMSPALKIRWRVGLNYTLSVDPHLCHALWGPFVVNGVNANASYNLCHDTDSLNISDAS